MFVFFIQKGVFVKKQKLFYDPTRTNPSAPSSYAVMAVVIIILLNNNNNN